MTTKRASVGSALVVVALALTVTAGCANDTTSAGTPTTPTSTTSTSATPTVDPNDPQAVAYAAATSLFQEYFELSQEIRQKPGMPDWEKVLGYTSGDVRINNIAIYERIINDGFVQQGEAHVASCVPTSYREDSYGGVEVTLAVCVDSSESNMAGWVTDPSVSKPGQPDRVSLTYKIVAFPQQGEELAWAVDRADIQEGTQC